MPSRSGQPQPSWVHSPGGGRRDRRSACFRPRGRPGGGAGAVADTATGGGATPAATAAPAAAATGAALGALAVDGAAAPAAGMGGRGAGGAGAAGGAEPDGAPAPEAGAGAVLGPPPSSLSIAPAVRLEAARGDDKAAGSAAGAPTAGPTAAGPPPPLRGDVSAPAAAPTPSEWWSPDTVLPMEAVLPVPNSAVARFPCGAASATSRGPPTALPLQEPRSPRGAARQSRLRAMPCALQLEVWRARISRQRRPPLAVQYRKRIRGGFKNTHAHTHTHTHLHQRRSNGCGLD
jgi:hypothetical protein